MFYNKEIEHLKNDSKYFNSVEYLREYILSAKIPPDKLLSKLYNKNLIPIIKDQLEKIYNKYIPVDGIIRLHEPSIYREIAVTRRKLSENINYLNVHKNLLVGKLPAYNELEFLYGQYTEKVRQVLKVFLSRSIKRKCGLFAPTHHNRVGALVGELGFNLKTPFKYSAIGCLHDSAEDLLNIVEIDGKKYGIHRYNEFLEHFIPDDLHIHIKLLTNNYDLIINEVAARFKAYRMIFSKETFHIVLDDITKIADDVIKKSIEDINILVDKFEPEENPLEEIRWLCYKSLFITEMAKFAKSINDYRTFQIKAVDLCDNAHGSRALDIDRRIKNILKLSFWAKEGFLLKTSWMPLNNFVMEVLDDALYHAENLVLSDLLEETSEVDFLMSAALKINRLQSIFFTNKDNK